MTLFIVLGCPRTGTSLIAGILQTNGVDMGYPVSRRTSDVELPTLPNPHGVFEDVEFSRRNAEVINGTKTGTFKNPPPVEEIAAQNDRGIADLLHERAQDNADVEWGFKDPRTIIAWPHYANALTADMHPRLIVIWRNPLNTARSWVLLNWAPDVPRALGVVTEYERRAAAIAKTWCWPMLHLSFEDWFTKFNRNKDLMDGFMGRVLDYSHFDGRCWRS